MKYLVLFNLICINLFSQNENKHNSVISNPSLNYMFKGIENNLEFSPTKIKNKKVGVLIKGCNSTYTIVGNCINIIPKQSGEVSISMFYEKRKDTIIFSLKRYRVHELPIPEIKICGQLPNTIISKNYSKNFLGVGTSIHNESYSDIRSIVTSFDIIIISQKEKYTFSCVGNTLSNEALDILRNKNDIIELLFENVFVKRSDNSIIKLKPAKYYVN